MESKRPTRCPPATPLRNYSSRRAAQLSNELINTNRTRQKYNQPVRNKHRWPYGGCSPQPGPWIQRAARSTHPPPARPAAPPSQPPHGPSRPLTAPRGPGPSRLRPGPADSERPSAAPERRRREEEEEGPAGRRGRQGRGSAARRRAQGHAGRSAQARAGSGHVPALSPRRRRTASGLRARGRRCRRGRGGGPALPTLRRPPRLAAAP